MSTFQEDADWLAIWRWRYLNEPELHAFVEAMLIEDRRKRDAEIERLRAGFARLADYGCDYMDIEGADCLSTTPTLPDSWCPPCVAIVAIAAQDAKSDADYIRSEAERLPNGTAARFLAALDAMDGATEPLEGGES